MFPVYDAIIIGGGPAGSFCAYKLSKQGMKVLLLESHTEIKRKVCGEYLSPSGVSILLEEGFKKDLVDPFPIVKGMKIVPAAGKPINTVFPKKNGISLNRQSFDLSFLEIAKDSGAQVQLGARVSELSRKVMGWQIKLSDGTTFQTRLLVGADGRNSFTAKALGLKNTVNTNRLALHCHIQAKAKNERFGEMHLFEDGSYIGVDPTGTYETNISLCCDSEKVKGHDLHEVLNNYIRKSPELMRLYGEVPTEIKINSVTPITNKMPKFISTNAALIGDAAGFLDPLTGEGMYNALWMARALAEEIEQSNSISIFNYQKALENYARRKNSFFRQKKNLNKIFQFIIKRPLLVNLLALFIGKKQERANVFVGIIGNIYRPIEGILKLFTV